VCLCESRKIHTSRRTGFFLFTSYGLTSLFALTIFFTLFFFSISRYIIYDVQCVREEHLFGRRKIIHCERFVLQKRAWKRDWKFICILFFTGPYDISSQKEHNIKKYPVQTQYIQSTIFMTSHVYETMCECNSGARISHLFPLDFFLLFSEWKNEKIFYSLQFFRIEFWHSIIIITHDLHNMC
jgi:hypothetical protein